MSEPLFRDVEGALRFAFQHFQASTARPLINRMADGPTRPGKGLNGHDGAGQAGLILSALTSLGEFSEAIAQARYLPHAIPCTCGSDCCTGWKANAQWRLAVDLVTERTADAIPHRRILYTLRKAVVYRYFGERANFIDIAKRCRVDRDTASAHSNAVATMLKAEEKRMRAMLAERLAAGQVIEP